MHRGFGSPSVAPVSIRTEFGTGEGGSHSTELVESTQSMMGRSSRRTTEDLPAVLLFDVDLLLLDVDGNSDLDGLLDDDLLEHWNLNRDGDRLGDLDDLVDRDGDVLRDLRMR